MTQSGGANIGGASFGIGVDLAQWERDLQRAEQIARTHASRIQGALGAIPMGQPVASGAVAAAGSATSHPVRPPAARQGAAVPAYVQEMFRQATAGGMSDQDARRSIARTLGMNVSDLASLGGGSSAGPRVSAGQAARSFQQEMRTQQQRAQRDAQLAGRAFSVVSTGRQVGGGSNAVGGGTLGFLGLSGPEGILRTVGALTGVGLGLNVAALAASRLHAALAGAVLASVQLEQASRNVGVAFGTGGRQFTGAGAAAFVGAPGAKGTEQEYLSAVAGLAPLAAQFGLTKNQVQALVVSEGQLARMHGTTLAEAGQVLESVLRGNIDAGAALDLQLANENGILHGVGLSWEQLVESQGRARAEQTLFARIQADVSRQTKNSAATTDDFTAAMDRLGNATDRLRSRAAQAAKGPVGAVAGGAASALEGDIPPELKALIPLLPALGPLAPIVATALVARRALTPTPPPPFTPGLPTEFANEQLAGQIYGEAPARDRERRVNDATEQARRASIQSRGAQAQIDTLGAQSDLRRLGVQQDINDLAAKRIEIENRLMQPMLEQQRVQDRITLTTRENLDLTEATLRAQQAAVGPSNASFELGFQQQKVRLQAQIQQSRAIRGLPPDPRFGNIPELFGQAYNLNLLAPETDYAALMAQHPADVAARAQAAAAGARQLGAIPDQHRLQQLQDQLIPLGQARSAAQTAADAIERSLQGADLATGPERIQAEKDLANARLQQADAAAKIAAAQAETNPTINANANVVIQGLADIESATKTILNAFYPVIINAINAAINNPRSPSGPPSDRGSR